MPAGVRHGINIRCSCLTPSLSLHAYHSPGGLKAKAPSGALIISGEDTLVAGEISRDLVADVCVASLTDPKASKKVLEIIEDEGVPAKVFNGLNM